MKILLIDDMAEKGWKQLLEKVFPIHGMVLESAINGKIAKEKLDNKYDLIFLDIRLERRDHFHRDIQNYSGYKILKKIRGEFLNANFSTPIILITASNKIWNINSFMDYGVDSYYIKEHPDNVFDKETSKENYDNFKENFSNLVELSSIRGDIWNSSCKIIKSIKNHKYFNENSGNYNVRERIIDKIKLGYYYRFKEHTSLEKNVLKVDNESIAFLIYFSILEELSKGFTHRNTWDDRFEFSGNWKFINNVHFIQKEDDGFEIKPYFEKGIYITKKIDLNDFKYNNGHINLSEQIYALIYHYGINENYKRAFKDLNEFRNRLSYTHSSVSAIYKDPLVDVTAKKNFNSNIEKVLSLINEILQHPN
jgi:CheY-like chemotaxis protein